MILNLPRMSVNRCKQTFMPDILDHMRIFKSLLFALCLMLVKPAAANDTPPISLTIKGSANLFLNGQSNTLEHRIKPGARLELLYHLYNELEVGIELAGNWDKNKNYRLIGGYFTAQVPIYSGSVFGLAMRTGWGMGTGPKILFTDLTNEADIVLWAQAGVQMRWLITSMFSATLAGRITSKDSW